jgi:hypothetical protein
MVGRRSARALLAGQEGKCHRAQRPGSGANEKLAVRAIGGTDQQLRGGGPPSPHAPRFSALSSISFHPVT